MKIKLAEFKKQGKVTQVIAIIPIPKTHPLSQDGKVKKLKKTFVSREEVLAFCKEQGLE